MILAATESVDLARILLDLLIVLAAAKLGAELAERFHIPAVLGEIAAGVAIGPSALGLLHLDGSRGVSIAVLAEVGVLLLLVQVGMEMDLFELRQVGRASLLVAIVGVALPFVGGAVAGVALGHDAKTSIFLGAALTATSVGITARVFGDLRALATTEARIVIGAAVADDVLGLVILTVVVKVVTGGRVGFATVAGTLGLAIAFLVGTGIVGLFLIPRLLDRLHRWTSSSTVVVAAMVLMLGFAELADLAKLAFIIGAFMAGLSFSRSAHHERIGSDLASVGNIFIPLFFVQIGLNADLGAMAKPSVLGLAAVLTGLGVLGKVAAGWGALGIRADKFLIGLGMIPRGEVGLIFASIGLSSGVLDKDLYGALLVVVLVTTVVTPPLLRVRLGTSSRRLATSPDTAVDAVEPEGGWVHVVGGEIRLHGSPPVTHTVAVAMQTALLLGEAIPSDEVLDWFGRHRDAEIEWDPDDTPALVNMLRRADTGVWRFLEVTGVLERTLPEIATSMRRRRSDIRELDPLSSLRFPIVEALHDLPPHGFAHDDDLVLAALAVDVCADATSHSECAEGLARRLGRASEADRVTDLVADAQLLRTSATHPASFEEPALLQLAAHLADPVYARRVHTLAVAMGGLPRRQADMMSALYEQLAEVLDHPELGGREAGNLAGSRLKAAQRLAVSPDVVERLGHASISYLLSHDPIELARQAQLVEPLPRSGTVRVAVSPDPEPDLWRIDVACRDSKGLLARLASVLADEQLPVTYASIATWPDGAVVDTFTVHAVKRPRAKHLAEAMERSLHAPLPRRSISGLQLAFDSDAMPWHTVCAVTGPDQPGTLEAVTAALAAADVVVHTARIATIDGFVADRFTVSDRVGRKLDNATEQRICKALEGGRSTRRRFQLGRRIKATAGH